MPSPGNNKTVKISTALGISYVDGAPATFVLRPRAFYQIPGGWADAALARRCGS